jgi:hypothetical protein
VTFAPGFSAQPCETVVKPWHQRRAVRLLGVVGAASLLLLLGYLRLRPAERIDAQPAAPTPAGFQVVNAPEYEFAAPQGWSTRVLDDAAKDELARRAGSISPGAGEKLQAAQDQGIVQGTQTIAVDPATGDNVNVVPYQALEGDPTDADELAQIKAGFSAEKTGIPTLAITASATDVHGFPAATVLVTANVAGQQVTLISTIIQTGDRVFQLTVSSSSAERARSLSAQILPTFDPH